MYFPEDMTFQYFFFTTYIGYFLQIIPISLIACILYIIVKNRTVPKRRGISIVLSSLFPAYLAALLGLTLFSEIIGDAYYILFYHRLPWPFGEGGYHFFTFVYNFKVTFIQDFSAENIGNILLFLPFGILHPIFNRQSTWWRTLLLGIGTCLLIEMIQPLVGRSFDLNDIILNAIGVGISTFVFFSLKTLLSKKHRQRMK